MIKLDETHDPVRRSWLASANAADTDFPIQNLPFAVFRRKSSGEAFRGGVALGDQILDLAAVHATGLIADQAAALAAAALPQLNTFMQLGLPAWRALRAALSAALSKGAVLEAGLRSCLVPQIDAEYNLPARIGDYTDFYTSIYHATTVGRAFRPEQPLLPNYKWLPIGYHGRSSSVVVSGQRFVRPSGQQLPPGASEPIVGPSKRLDYELELGLFIGPGNVLGSTIPLESAESHIFGMCLLNDWSARDLQAWEYQPLGPFLAKSFATTISPWIVTLDALAPYRVAFQRPAGDPAPLPYLDSQHNRDAGAFDIQLEVALASAAMRGRSEAPTRLSRTSYRHAYWTAGQLVTHHSAAGCNLQPGDLLGTGTQSGPSPAEAGSLLELTAGGKQPLQLGSGETRGFLEDGDSVVFHAWCEGPGAARIGFGEVYGEVLPALAPR